MYGELAAWWPLISPPADYEEEAGFVASLLGAHQPPVVEVLELGSGGGHNAVHLRRSFTMTLVDLSPDMLAMSRRLNPDCAHHVGDMRTVRLGRTFDAVFVHDALAYMTTRADLQAAAHTAFAHCRPGGLAVFEPDDTAETFVTYTDHGGNDGDDGRSVRYLEWVWDPDPDDTEVQGEFVFALREPDGTVRTVHDTHHWGLFPRAVWLDVLAVAGFEAEAVLEVTTEHREPRELFLGRRPAQTTTGNWS
jgi:SAM-dependent methyltransferase